jgi:hypothetical protein
MRNIMIKQFVKGSLFVFGFHLLTVVNILLSWFGVYGGIGSFVYQLILSVSVIPTYFFVKNESLAPWRYSIVAVVSHIIFSLVTILVFGMALADSFDVIMILFLENINVCTFSIVFLIDIFVNIKTHKK